MASILKRGKSYFIAVSCGYVYAVEQAERDAANTLELILGGKHTA